MTGKVRGPSVGKEHPLLDNLKVALNIPTDKELSNYFGRNGTLAAKIRGRFARVSDELMVDIHDATGWSIAEIKAMVPKEDANV